MPSPDLITSNPRRLHIFTGLLAFGTLCPALGIGTMAASVAGGVVANELIPFLLNKPSVKLSGSEDKLANHDITNAAGLAVGLLIQSVAESGKYSKEGKKNQEIGSESGKRMAKPDCRQSRLFAAVGGRMSSHRNPRNHPRKPPNRPSQADRIALAGAE